MTDPIGTAQERELIERLNDHARNVGGDDSYERLYGNDAIAAADALQSRIAEVGALRELLKDARHKVKIYSGINGKAVQHWERNLIDKIDAALSLQRRV